MSFSLRKAADADIENIWAMFLDLVREQGAEKYLATSLSDFRKVVSEDKPLYVLAGCQNDELIAFVTYIYGFSMYRMMPVLYMKSLYVKPEFRRRGIGRKIISELARCALQDGCCGMQWNVLMDNTPALNFYKELGFEVDDDSMASFFMDPEQLTFFANNVENGE